jgi:biopolymer transport protein ExbD
MSLKRRNRANAAFSMASMTDVIFLLLIFFMISSTIVIPNAIKVNLPQAQKQTSAKPLTRITIDKQGRYYVAQGREREKEVGFNDITPFLLQSREKEPEMYVALYADQEVPYREIVQILDLANEHHFKMVLVTNPRRR